MRPKSLLIAAAVLAFALRLGYAATGALWRPETWETEDIATNLVKGRGFLYVTPRQTFRSYAEPMYPYLAAAVYWITGHSRTALVIVQLILASLTVWIAGRMTLFATGDGAIAVATALLLAVHPGLIRYSSVLHPFVLDVLFFTMAAFALLRYERNPTLGRGCAAAALIGLGVLTRPTILIFLLPMWWIAWRSSDKIKQIVAITATALAIVAPWTIRNATIHHEFVLTRSGSGYVFWLGNNPMSSGSATDVAGRPIWRDAPEELQRRILAAADETALDRIFREEAWRYVRAHPAAAAARVVQRLYYFWWFSPQWGAAYMSGAKLIYRLWWSALLLLIAVGLISRKVARELLLLASLAILVSVLQSLYYVEGRHRLAIEPLIVPLAAVGTVASVRRRQGPSIARRS